MVSRQLPAEQPGLVGQPAYRRLEALRPLQLAAQPTVLPVLLTGLPDQQVDSPAFSALIVSFCFCRRVSRALQPAGYSPVRADAVCAARSDLRSEPRPLRATPRSSSFCPWDRSSALRSRALARGGEACAARFDLRSAATFLRNATSSSFCSCERSSALRSRAFSLDSGPVVSFLAAGAGAALSGRGPPPGGARSHSSERL